MAGIIALVLLVIWLLIIKGLTSYLISLVKGEGAKVIVAVTAFPALFLSPWADEIIAIPQIEKICSEAKSFKIDSARTKGRELKLEIEPSWAPVEGTILPVRYSHYSFREVNSNEEVASYNAYRVTGGWLSRSINFNSVNGPWLARSHCDIGISANAFAKQHGATLIN